MPPRHRSVRTGDLPEALAEWCQWIFLHADLAHRTAPLGARSPEGEPMTWLDYCGVQERLLIEAAMRAGVFVPVDEPEERKAQAAHRRKEALRLGAPVDEVGRQLPRKGIFA